MHMTYRETGLFYVCVCGGYKHGAAALKSGAAPQRRTETVLLQEEFNSYKDFFLCKFSVVAEHVSQVQLSSSPSQLDVFQVGT